MSNIPIVVFNRHQNLYKKKKDLFLSLKKRCSVINTNINKYGKITFNEKKFIMGINKSLDLKSHEIVRKFAIGQT